MSSYVTRRLRTPAGALPPRAPGAEGPKVVKTLLLTDVLLATYTGREEKMSSVLTEALLEHVRASHFPEMPKRIGAGVFLAPTKQAAVQFQELTGAHANLFICETEGPVSIVFDMALLNPSPGAIFGPITDYLRDLEERAVRYWKGERSDTPIFELIATGTVIVREQII